MAGCTHPLIGIEIESGYVPVKLDGYDATWRPIDGLPVTVGLNGWLRCQVCGQLTSVESDQYDLGDGFLVLPDDDASTDG